MKKIAVLGSTGSIGTQTLDVVRSHKDEFEVCAICAGKNALLALEQAKEFMPELICMEDEAAALAHQAIAMDGIAVIVNPANTVEDLDIETIAKIYTGEITNWSEVGGADAEIVLVGREAGSGTRSGFEELTETVDKCKYRQELTSTGDVITAVAQNPDAIGYASLASVKDSVKALKVAGVTPTEETVKDGTYLIQRPFVLVTKEGVALSPVAQAFFDYATKGQANDIITASGVVPANG